MSRRRNLVQFFSPKHAKFENNHQPDRNFPEPSFIKPLTSPFSLEARDERPLSHVAPRRRVRRDGTLEGLGRAGLWSHRLSPSVESTSTSSTKWTSPVAGDEPRPRVLDCPDTDEFFTLPSHVLMDHGGSWYPDGAWEAARIARTYGFRSIAVFDTPDPSGDDGSKYLTLRIVGHHGLSQNDTPHRQSRELLRRLRDGGCWLPVEDGMLPMTNSQGIIRQFGAKVIAINFLSSEIVALNNPFLLQDVETLLEVVSNRDAMLFTRAAVSIPGTSAEL